MSVPSGSARQRRRRCEPPREPLNYAIATEQALDAAKVERGQAFFSAAAAGWTMREIGDAVGLSFSTVWRIIVAHEERSA